MSYQVWSVVFGEQPSASKWNILGQNDASFNDGTGIADNAILNRHLASAIVSNAEMATDTWLWEKLADVTLGSASDSLSSGTFTARKFLKFFAHIIPSGNIQTQMRFNNDSGANYAHRYMLDNAVGSSGVSATNIGDFNPAGATTVFVTGEMSNYTAQHKLGKSYSTHNVGGAGAGTAPSYVEFFHKWVNTSVQCTRIDMINASTGDFATGSRIVVLGHD